MEPVNMGFTDAYFVGRLSYISYQARSISDALLLYLPTSLAFIMVHQFGLRVQPLAFINLFVTFFMECSRPLGKNFHFGFARSGNCICFGVLLQKFSSRIERPIKYTSLYEICFWCNSPSRLDQFIIHLSQYFCWWRSGKGSFIMAIGFYYHIFHSCADSPLF